MKYELNMKFNDEATTLYKLLRMTRELEQSMKHLNKFLDDEIDALNCVEEEELIALSKVTTALANIEQRSHSWMISELETQVSKEDFRIKDIIEDEFKDLPF